MKIYADPRLSLKAKGIWYTMNALLDEGETPTIKYLWEHSHQDGQGKIRRGIQELEKLGYFERKKIIGKGIKFEYYLHDEVDNEHVKIKIKVNKGE